MAKAHQMCTGRPARVSVNARHAACTAKQQATPSPTTAVNHVYAVGTVASTGAYSSSEDRTGSVTQVTSVARPLQTRR
jgi:hypothetical protein